MNIARTVLNLARYSHRRANIAVVYVRQVNRPYHVSSRMNSGTASSQPSDSVMTSAIPAQNSNSSSSSDTVVPSEAASPKASTVSRPPPRRPVKKSRMELLLDPFVQLGVGVRDAVTNFVRDFVDDVKFVATRDFSEVLTPKTVFLAGGSASTSSPRTAQAKRRVNATDTHGSNNMTMFEKVHSDSEYGGASTCSSEVMFTTGAPVSFDSNNTTTSTTTPTTPTPTTATTATQEEVCEGESIASYVRFQGELNFAIDKNAKRKTFGFCAAQAVCLRTMDLKVCICVQAVHDCNCDAA